MAQPGGEGGVMSPVPRAVPTEMPQISLPVVTPVPRLCRGGIVPKVPLGGGAVHVRYIETMLPRQIGVTAVGSSGCDWLSILCGD